MRPASASRSVGTRREETLRTAEIRKAAAAVLGDKREGVRLPVELERLLAGERVELEYFDSPSRFDGRIEVVRGVPAIFVNLRGKRRDDGRVRFTLAHEIAHFYLHGH